MANGEQSVGSFDVLLAIFGGAIIGVFTLIICSQIVLLWSYIKDLGSIILDFTVFSPNYDLISDTQLILILFGFDIFFGFLMGHIFHMNRYKPKTSAYLSFLATAVSSTIIGAYVIFEYIPAQDYRKMPNNYYINDNTLFNIISNNGIESWIALLGYFVISVSLAALSTYLFIMLYAIKREHSGHKKLIKNTGRVLIVLIIIPLLIAFMAAGTGKVERYPNLGTIHWNMSAQRVANDTIVIINNGYHNPDGVDLGYYINKNMSFMMMAFNETGWYNSSADSWYRLNFTVNSETVLGGESGQKVTVTGPEYSSVNNTTVEILLYNDNETFVYNNIYLGRL